MMHGQKTSNYAYKCCVSCLRVARLLPLFQLHVFYIVVVFGAECKLCSYSCKNKNHQSIVYLLRRVGLKLLQFMQLLEPRGSAVPRFLISYQIFV